MLILTGDGHTIVVLSDGSALAYGLCDRGQLGIGNMPGSCKVCDVTTQRI
jgi:alpha-tubulin suppressor-like RCC1 family protein